MIPRIPVEIDEEDTGPPTRFWRRPGVIVVAVLIVAVVGYAAFRPKEDAKHSGAKPNKADAFIGEVVAYQSPMRIVAPDKDIPEPPPQPPPPPVPSPPPPPPPEEKPLPAPNKVPGLRDLMPPKSGQQATGSASTRSKMLVYALPPMEKPSAAPPPDPQTDIGFKTATLPGMQASPAIDDTYQLMPGLLPLVLDTAVESDVPGPLLAHLPGPVYSPKGVLLMEANTQVIGKYEKMGQGHRLAASSVYAHTPKGVWVPLGGQMFADELGRSGMPGEVDNHVLPRFGPAILLTLTDQALHIFQAEVSKGGNTYLNLNSGGGSGVGSLAQQILQEQIKIPPTFNKHQGEMMALFLDQPIDFSKSYRIQPVKGQ